MSSKERMGALFEYKRPDRVPIGPMDGAFSCKNAGYTITTACLADLAPWPHPSVFSFGHEVDLDVAAKLFPGDIVYGNIEPVVIQIGKPRQVYELSKTAIEKGGKATRGFILAPGCGLPPASPPVNVFAMTKAVNHFGWYE